MRKLFSIVPLSLLVCAILASSAHAGNVTVGLPLTSGNFATGGAEATSFLVTNTALSDPGANVVSPVDGAIVGWHLRAAEGAGFQIYTLKPDGGTTYTVTGSTASGTPMSSGLVDFPALLPIKAGEAVGLFVPPGAQAGIAEGIDDVVYWQPALTVGSTAAGGVNSPSLPYAFNVEVQPAPTVRLFQPTSSAVAGGSTMLLVGTDLVGVKEVKFGSVLAAFTEVDDGEISVVIPPSSGPGPVPVSVTTIAGTGTAAEQFTYNAPPATVTNGTIGPAAPAVVVPRPQCTVPNLSGRKLKASKKSARVRGCGIGTVTKRKGTTAKTGRVVKQSPKPGTVVAAGTKIKVTLGG